MSGSPETISEDRKDPVAVEAQEPQVEASEPGSEERESTVSPGRGISPSSNPRMTVTS